jgi:exodeoxyribonuclease V alpha subunit
MNTFSTETAGITPKAPARASPTLATLYQWSESQWLRRLDAAMAGFVAELDPDAAPALLAATALVTHMEGRGHTCLGLEAVIENPNALLAWPTDAQPALSALWSTLPQDLPGWLAALHGSKVVRKVGRDRDQGQPLVLVEEKGDPRLYLRRYWNYERQVAGQFLQRAGQTLPVNEAVAAQWLDRLFATDPASLVSAGQKDAVDWQKLACAVALRGRLCVTTGGPGTGKTYTAARLLALLFAVDPHPELLRVALAAPTGKAAARLKQSIDTSLAEVHARLGAQLDLPALMQRIGAARTLHSLLGARPDTRQFRFNASQPLDVDVLIVDEASMVHLEMMAALLDALPPTARVIFLGDKDQLASVEAGAVLGDLCREAELGRYSAETVRFAAQVAGQTLPDAFRDNGESPNALAQQTVMLRESRRFGGPIGQLALAVNRGDAREALRLLANDSTQVLQVDESAAPTAVLQLALHGRQGTNICYQQYLSCLANKPIERNSNAPEAWVKSVLTAFERFRLLCAVREGTWGTLSLNREVERAMASAGLLKPRGEWYAGRPVMITRNDPALGVFNGDIGIALPSATPGAGLRVYFSEGDSLRSVAVSRLAHVETAFAMTVHKSQGSEFEHTALILPNYGGGVVNRELVYTGITRARKSFTLLAGSEGLLAKAVHQLTQRASGLRSMLDE